MFAQTFEEKYLAFQQKHGITEKEKDVIPTIEDKTTMSYNLFKLPPVIVGLIKWNKNHSHFDILLGDILSYLHNEYPDCIDNTSSSQIQLNVDAIPPKFFWEVYKKVFEELGKTT